MKWVFMIQSIAFIFLSFYLDNQFLAFVSGCAFWMGVVTFFDDKYLKVYLDKNELR